MPIEFTYNGRSILLDVTPETTIDDASALLEAELLVPGHELALNGIPCLTLSPTATLRSIGLDGLSIAVTRVGDVSSRVPRRGGRGVGDMLRRRPLPPAISPDIYSSLTLETLPPGLDAGTLHAILAVNPTMMSALERRDPEFAAAAREVNPTKLRALLMSRHLDYALPAAEERLKLAKIQANPDDIEAQRLMEDLIQQQNIANNRDMAFEHMPELFARVHMLYVDSKVNGCPLKLFVDSGAYRSYTSAMPCGHTNIDVKL